MTERELSAKVLAIQNAQRKRKLEEVTSLSEAFGLVSIVCDFVSKLLRPKSLS